jgi:cytochrome P450
MASRRHATTTAATDSTSATSPPDAITIIDLTASAGTDRPPLQEQLPTATVLDTVTILTEILLPLVARGVIVRRPAVVAMAERLELDKRAVRRMQRLRRRYGSGPLVVRLPFRRIALVLDPDHVHRVLEESPRVFSAANFEKQHALGHFQPEGVLISEGAEREDRRRFNEAVLETPRPVHGLADAMLAKVREEADSLLTTSRATGFLRWDDFIESWFRVVRRVTFGDGAADDERLTDMSGALRANANWSFLRPKDRQLREAFLDRVRDHVERAEPGSLAEMMARVPTTSMTEPHQQVPQWLFAFDPAGIAAFRALALIESHPEHARRVREELRGRDLSTPQELPLLRATVLESLRLWPTTPGILRDAKVETLWERGVLPAGSGVLIFAPFFHRDDRRLREANRFAPELWASPRSTDAWPLVPFSEGPVVCPGQNLVLLLTTAMVAALLEQHDLRPKDALDPSRPLPSVLNPFGLSFDLRPASVV